MIITTERLILREFYVKIEGVSHEFTTKALVITGRGMAISTA